MCIRDSLHLNSRRLIARARQLAALGNRQLSKENGQRGGGGGEESAERIRRAPAALALTVARLGHVSDAERAAWDSALGG
eukprot:1034738-Prorocentrum_minimum.AAC.1